MGSNVNSQFKNKANYFELSSLALDELTDVTDTLKWLIIWGAYSEFGSDWRISLYEKYAWKNYKQDRN